MTNRTTLDRRALLKAGLGVGIAIPTKSWAQPPNRARPQPGDWLVFDGGENSGQRITPDLLALEQRPVAALAKDPATSTLRDGSRLNRVMITRLDPTKLSEATKPHAAAGVIAFSAVCTHTGCDVINWVEDKLLMACPCHESHFDVYNGANVVGGPAPRPLAILPLSLESGSVVVAAGFTGRVGFTQQF